MLDVSVPRRVRMVIALPHAVNVTAWDGERCLQHPKGWRFGAPSLPIFFRLLAKEKTMDELSEIVALWAKKMLTLDEAIRRLNGLQMIPDQFRNTLVDSMFVAELNGATPTIH